MSTLFAFTACDDTATEPDTSAPDAPGALIFDVNNTGDGKITMSWEENTESDFDFYIIYRSDGNDESFLAIDSVSTAQYTDTINLEFDITYYYRLKAIDNNGNESEFSSIQSTIHRNVRRPSQPVFTKISASNEDNTPMIILNWEKINEIDFSNYELYKGNDAYFSTDGIDPDTVLYSETFIDFDIQTSQRYFYKLIAVDTGNKESDPSDVIDDIALAPTTLTYPINEPTSSVNPTFEWDKLEDALYYYLSVRSGSSSGEIANIRVEQPASGNIEFSYPTSEEALIAGNKYYWSVTTYSIEDGQTNSSSETKWFLTPAK